MKLIFFFSSRTFLIQLINLLIKFFSLSSGISFEAFRYVIVQLASVISGTTRMWIRERSAEKAQGIFFDPASGFFSIIFVKFFGSQFPV